MSYSRFLLASALVPAALFAFPSSPEAAALSHGHASTADCTHTHTSTLSAEPASRFIDMNRAFKTAAVCFFGYGDCDTNEDYEIDPELQCLNEGFSKQNCNSVQTIDGVCPYHSAYGLGCKCVSNLITCPTGQVGVGESCGGKYASCQCDPKLVSCASNQVGQGASCGGKYQSCACKSEYVYNSSNCKSPRSLSGASCGGKYTGCSCPSGVSAGTYGCAEYYGSPCSSVCKKAYTDNCHKRTDNNSALYGCMKYWADCPSKCETPYKDNCRNRTAVSTPYGCQTYWSDCSTKCQKAYADNCRNRAAVSTPYGCQTYWSDCSTKCQKAYEDNCRNRTAVARNCPANAICTYFPDCLSKISGWSCNSGYEKNGAICVAVSEACEVGSIYYSDDTCSSASNYNAGKTVLGVVVEFDVATNKGHVMAHKPVSPCGGASTGLQWSDEEKNVEGLVGMGSESEAGGDFASCANTNVLINDKQADHPAAEAARNYLHGSKTWCLPAAGVVRYIYEQKATIDNSLRKINGDTTLWNTQIWSSTASSSRFEAWNGFSGYTYLQSNYKTDYKCVYPVFEFWE